MMAINLSAGGIGGQLGLRWLNRHSADIERLATGRRINRGSDDPSGLIASEKLSAEQVVLERRLQGLELRGHRMAALDGALGVVSELLIDLQGTVVAAANTGGLTEGEREAYQLEADSILQTLDHLKNTTVYNGEYLLRGANDGQTGAVQVEREGGETASAGLNELRRGGRFDALSGDPELAQQVVRGAIEEIALQRAAAGNVARDLESQQRSLAVELENVAGAKSAIVDTDYAAEVGNLVRSQVLQKAAVFAVMTARNISAQSALALLG